MRCQHFDYMPLLIKVIGFYPGGNILSMEIFIFLITSESFGGHVPKAISNINTESEKPGTRPPHADSGCSSGGRVGTLFLGQDGEFRPVDCLAVQLDRIKPRPNEGPRSREHRLHPGPQPIEMKKYFQEILAVEG